MSSAIRNLDFIRNLPDFGAKLYEALHDTVSQVTALAQQVNGNPTGEPLAPPSVSGLKVTGQNGHFQVAIRDEGKVYRGIQYYVEHADNPQFVNPQVVKLGDSRNGNLTLGNVTRYFRAYSAYPTSGPGAPSYHGSPIDPQPVAGGGSLGGPDFLPSEGSGTGAPGVGISGPGPVPFRSDTGAAPIRGENAGPSGGESSAIISHSAAGLPPDGGSSSGGGSGGGGAGTVTSATVTQSGLAALAATLDAASAGFRAYVSDYDHTLAWTGAGWSFASGERSAYIVGFIIDPSPTTGWKLCDGLGDDGNPISGGSPAQYLKSDGTLGSITSASVAPCLPNLVGNPSVLQLGAADTGVVAPIAPVLTMNSYTPAGSVSLDSTAAGSGGPGAGNATFAGTPATLTGTIGTTGEAQKVVLRPWMRR